MKKFYIIIILVTLLFSPIHILAQSGRFIFKTAERGVMTNKMTKDISDEKDKLIIEITNKNKELQKTINSQKSEIQRLKKQNIEQAKLIADLLQTIDDLNLSLKEKDRRFDDLLEKYIAILDTLVDKNVKIGLQKSELKRLKSENENLKKKLAQKSPNWMTGFLNPHPNIKNAYVMTVTANTSNFDSYFESKKSIYPNAKITADLFSISLGSDELITPILDIGDGEFKSCDVSVSESFIMQLSFKIYTKLKRNSSIFPIIKFHLEYDGIIEDLGFIENIKIEM